jgi:hypothetical protein
LRGIWILQKRYSPFPEAFPGLAPLQIDLANVYKAESRIPEVAFVTPQKAPELLALFIDAYSSLSKHLVALDFERSQAERAANKIRGIIMLDKIPGILAEKGLASSRSPLGSEDVRQAILDTDIEYTTALDKIDALSAGVELIKGKLKSVEMAYTSVKKILGEGCIQLPQSQSDRSCRAPGKRRISYASIGQRSPWIFWYTTVQVIRYNWRTPCHQIHLS